MKYFLILLFLVGFTTSFLFGNHVYGLWMPLSPAELLKQSETIFVGTVTAVNPVDVEYQSQIARNGTIKESVGPEVITLEEYTVEVEEFLKTSQDYATIKLRQATVGGVPGGPARISGFEVGDRVLFYLPNDEKQTHFPMQYLPESFTIPKQCDAKTVLEIPRIDGRNQFSIIQEGIQREDNFTAKIPIQYSYARDGGTLGGHSFDVIVGISKVTDSSIENVFQKKIQAKSESCEWIGSAKWQFIPQSGNYRMTVQIFEDGGGTGFSKSFSVKENTNTFSSEATMAKLEWSQLNYEVTNGTGTAKVIVTDPDMDVIPTHIDTLKVFVFSDSFQEGITLTLYETGKDTGVFERIFTFSDKRSAPNVLYTKQGDTATVHYVDTTLPSDSESASVKMTETTLIGRLGYPLERAPASHARVVDNFGNTLDLIGLHEQVSITSDIANGYNREQKFIWFAQIKDEKNQAVSLGWIDGVLNPETSFSPSMSWIPQKQGDYTATMFVWESLDNPSALSPPISIEFTVGGEELKNQRYNDYEEMFLFIIPQEDLKHNLDREKLAKLHFYKIKSKEELSKLPRLGLLINMTRDFTEKPVTELKLRINDSQLQQYHQFFAQKCHDERPYADFDSCQLTDLAFEYDEKWYYLYNALAPHSPTIEDSYPSWDENYFKNN